MMITAESLADGVLAQTCGKPSATELGRQHGGFKR